MTVAKKLFLLTLLMIVLPVSSALCEGVPEIAFFESVLEFGHVGVDYDVYYNFKFFNKGTAPLEIESAVANCDCSHTSVENNVLKPGDTSWVRLRFGTRNYYGPTSQSFTIKSNDPKRPEVKIFYTSTVGQYVRGIKPAPASLMFLPGNPPKKITINNTLYEEMEVTVVDQADPFFEVKLLEDDADKGDSIELEVVPGHTIPKGTHNSNFRLRVSVTGREEAVVITVPVKIVKY